MNVHTLEFYIVFPVRCTEKFPNKIYSVKWVLCNGVVICKASLTIYATFYVLLIVTELTNSDDNYTRKFFDIFIKTKSRVILKHSRLLKMPKILHLSAKLHSDRLVNKVARNDC